mgnify:CR=1 FL=1
MATIPSVMNKKGVRLSGCFIPDVCNSKVNRIRVRGERYESGHAIRRRDVPLQIPSSHYLLSVLFVNYVVNRFFSRTALASTNLGLTVFSSSNVEAMPTLIQ